MDFKNLTAIFDILLKYGEKNSVEAEHDVIYITAAVDPEDVSPEDIKRIEELGAGVSEEYDCFYYYV